LCLIDPTNFKLFKGELSFERSRIAMVNYNYKLNFKINRDLLKNEIEKYKNFFVRYDRIKDTSVVIESPYKKEYVKGEKKKKGIPHHTFRLHKTGTVVQSGPGGELTKNIYYEFMNIIKKIHDSKK